MGRRRVRQQAEIELVWNHDQDVPPEVHTAAQLDQDVGHQSWGSATWWRHARDNQATTVVLMERSAARHDETCPLVEC